MKRRILIVLAIVALFSLTLFAACEQPCEHDYAVKYDGEQHWQECKLCGDKKDEATHELTWVATDADNHWQVCECGYKASNSAAHVDVKVNATNADGSDELCDVCGRNLHAHVYTWHSDTLNHWEECSCSDKKTSSAHVDEINNETKAETPDGLCDVCGKANYSVTFDMRGHGNAVASQTVYAGGKVAAPETVEDDDCYKFAGWYADARCTAAFDFETAEISENTVVYAKWNEDKTEGASQKYAYVLELDQENPAEAVKNEGIYFVYTAAESGRYKIAMGMGDNNENSAFTTSLSEGTYGKDCDLQSITLDMRAEQKIYIVCTYLGDAADVTISPLVEQAKNEPLPADHFADGEYYNSNYSLIIDRTKKELTFNEVKYSFRYIGGSFDYIYFVQDLGSIKVTYKLIYEDGSYTFVNDMTPQPTELKYFVAQDPVALNKLFGYYEPQDNQTNGISALYIYVTDRTDGTDVRYVQQGYYRTATAVYNTEKNRLIFESNMIQLNLASDGSVESLQLGENIYVRKGDVGEVPPESLPLESNAEYVGAEYMIRTPYSQYFGATGYNVITVIDYNKTTDIYEISVDVDEGTETYKLTVSQDKKEIKLYDNDNKLLDTLVKFEWVFHELPVSDGSVSAKAEDYQRGIYLLQSQQAGFYQFTVPQNVTLYYAGLNEYDYTDYQYAKTAQSGVAVYLAEDQVLLLTMATPADATIELARVASPAGYEQSKPLVMTNESASLDVFAEQTLYLTYNAPSAGTYLVKVSYGNFDSTMLAYKVNGIEYGCVNWVWTEGMSYDFPYAKIAVAANALALNIEIDCQDGWESVTVTVSEDYSAGATELVLTGTPDGDSVTVTATADSGSNYKIANTYGEDVTVTGSSEFVIKLQGGNAIMAEEVNGQWKAVIEAGTDVIFKLESATQQQLTFTQTFAKGSESYPIAVTLEDGVKTLTVPKVENAAMSSVYFTLPAGVYTISSDADPDDWYVMTSLYVNDQFVSEGYVFVVEEGDILSFLHNDDEKAVVITIKEVKYVFSEEQAGTYKGQGAMFGSPLPAILSFDRFGIGKYSNSDETTYDISITENDGIYSFSYEGVTVYITFDGNNIVLDDQMEWFDEPVTLEKQVAAQSVTYSGSLPNNDFKLVISGDKVSYSVDVGDEWEIGADNVTPTQSGNMYTFETENGDTVTYFFNNDGNGIIISDSYYGEGMGTKQA